MPRYLACVTLASVILILSTPSCKKDNQPDPVKEANNSRVEVKPPVIRPVSAQVNASSGGFYIALPSLYDSTSKAYPLLISLHGGGQYGDGQTDLPLILAAGVPRLINNGEFPANFVVNGQNFSFIVIAPQFSRYPATVEIKSYIDYAKKHYRVDANRVYLTGLSVGASATWDAAIEYIKDIAAIVPVSGAPKDQNNVKARAVAEIKLPVWTFQNKNDDVSNPIYTKEFIDLINSYSPAIPPKFTLFDEEGHNAWSRATNPAYKENNKNIYEWMLQYSKN